YHCDWKGPCGHAARKNVEHCGIGIPRGDTGLPRSTARHAGPQRGRERGPHVKELCIKVLQRPSNIRGLAAIEVKVCFLRIGVASILMANEHAKRDKGIEKVTGAAWINADSLLDRCKV